MGLTWFIIMILIPLICFSYFIFFRPTSLWTGFFFMALTGSLYLTLILQIEKVNQQIASIIALPVVIVVALVGLFGMLTGVIALFWNEGILLKREGFSIANLLPVIVAVGLVLFQVLLLIFAYYVGNPWLSLLSFFITTCFAYTIGTFFFYLVTSILYNHYPFFGKVDYIIVLGAGLIDGERVTPLLASRIDVAVKLFNKQKKRKNHEPTIILSGGQGPDEKISESKAMHNYLLEKGYELGNVYLEEKSTNTKENLQFSETIIYQKDNIKNLNKKNIVIASNNYHVLRAGKLASKLGIFARGIGSKTKAYYLPTAFIREYIGYLAITKKRHMWFFGIVLSGVLLLGVLQFLIMNV
ncbi:YdcF family protein [Vagococcus sp. DIV0080]|uniref:YdcF family protein n=1 Tax=Candidatus Vagococcus giribetii TaxID=2230876 RepID=A0ABS3HSA2_9ENTE|nr:YdcF family protein [Vagococcus sp. DIV0080]MBO0476087.1 YdcF family protein [Vagococcus sp. DIV0080]